MAAAAAGVAAVAVALAAAPARKGGVASPSGGEDVEVGVQGCMLAVAGHKRAPRVAAEVGCSSNSSNGCRNAAVVAVGDSVRERVDTPFVGLGRVPAAPEAREHAGADSQGGRSTNGSPVRRPANW